MDNILKYLKDITEAIEKDNEVPNLEKIFFKLNIKSDIEIKDAYLHISHISDDVINIYFDNSPFCIDKNDHCTHYIKKNTELNLNICGGFIKYPKFVPCSTKALINDIVDSEESTQTLTIKMFSNVDIGKTYLIIRPNHFEINITMTNKINTDKLMSNERYSIVDNQTSNDIYLNSSYYTFVKSVTV